MCRHHHLNPVPEPLAGPCQGRPLHVPHHPGDAALQGHQNVMGTPVHIPHENAPNIIVQGVTVRRGGVPEVPGSESPQALSEPVLGTPSIMGGSAILLKDVQPVPAHPVHPGLHHIPQHIYVLIHVDFEALGEEIGVYHVLLDHVHELLEELRGPDLGGDHPFLHFAVKVLRLTHASNKCILGHLLVVHCGPDDVAETGDLLNPQNRA